MDLTKEQIEKVARFSGVTWDEARAALEQAGGSPLDAVILLEQHGRSKGGPGGVYSTRAGFQRSEGAPLAGDAQRLEGAPLAGAAGLPRRKAARRKYTAREVGDAVKGFLRNCTKITVDIWRGEDLLAGVPLVVCVLLFVVAFKLMLVLALVGLALRCRYHISGWEGDTADINRTMDRVSETVAGWTDQVKAEFSRQWDRERSRESEKK